MYGYGYRYPRVPREVRAVYTDPEYRYKWIRAAIMNKAVAARSPWLKFLRDEKYLERVGNLLREVAARCRGDHLYTEKDKTFATRRKTKLDKAIEAFSDANIRTRLSTEFGPKYNASYAEAVIKRLQEEIDRLNAIIAGKNPYEGLLEKLKKPEEKKGMGYGLLSGLGEGYGYFY
jgi:hypothetical protein